MKTGLTRVGLGALVGAAVLGSLGCSDDFLPYNRLASLRVLAIKGEPSAPGPGEMTTLSPLIFTLPNDPVATMGGYQWLWCPLPGFSNDGYECLVTERELTDMLGGSITVPPFDLGTNETATFTHTLPPELLAGLCTGMVPGLPIRPDCENGFPTQIKLIVRSMSGDEIVTVWTLWLRFDPASTPNLNPTFDPAVDEVDRIVAVVGGADQSIFEMPMMDPTVSIPRDVETEVRIGLTEEAAESYQGLDDNGVPATLRERLTVSWFAESGNFEADEHTVFIEGVEPIEDTRRNRWTPALPEDDDRVLDRSSIIVVIRDNRGGVDWVRGQVLLGATP